MNTKNIKHLFLSLITVGFLLFSYSCNDDYLGVNPDNRLELDTEEKIRNVLVTAYPQSSHYLLTEMASDNTDENAAEAYSPFGLQQEQSYRWQDVIGNDIDTPYDIWSKYYYSIQTACAAVEAIQQLKDEGRITDEKNAQGIDAEARLCRAYGHFILVNLFSKTYGESSETDLGIPYILETDKNLIVERSRGTVEEVYKKIEEDLEIALPNVNKISQSTTGTSNKGIAKYHWNKQAAYAFAARFFLYYKKYDRAIHYATLALGSDPSMMLRDWATDGRDFSKVEMAYDRYISVDQDANFLLIPAESLWGRVSGPYNYGLGMATQNITMQEIANNTELPFSGRLRYPFKVYLSGALATTLKVGEYFEYYDKTAGIGWTHIVQVPFTADRTLLERAEAYALSNQLDKATADLDIFVKRYAYSTTSKNYTESKEKLIQFVSSQPFYEPTATTDIAWKKRINVPGLSSDQENVLYPILLAKRSLTIHEGERWFDINRYNITIYRRSISEGTPFITDELRPDDPRRVFQIPQQMVVAGIEPNPR